MRDHVFVKSAASLIILFILAAAPIVCAQDHQSLLPLLIDLKGWSAEKPQGMSTDMGGMKMINAGRNYSKDDKELIATLIVGNQTMTQGMVQAMKSETPEQKVTITKIDGFQVSIVHNKNENSTMLMIFLSQGKNSGAMFILMGESLSQDETIKIAKQFNWEKMKSVSEKLF